MHGWPMRADINPCGTLSTTCHGHGHKAAHFITSPSAVIALLSSGIGLFAKAFAPEQFRLL
jgi:hypothetical protein